MIPRGRQVTQLLPSSLWNSRTLWIFNATSGSGQTEQADFKISIGSDRALAQGLAKVTAH